MLFRFTRKERDNVVIYILPDDTILIPGYGPYTMVSEEKKYNPYLNGFDA